MKTTLKFLRCLRDIHIEHFFQDKKESRMRGYYLKLGKKSMQRDVNKYFFSKRDIRHMQQPKQRKQMKEAMEN